MNYMPGSSNSLFNLFVFHGQRKASSAAKLRHICSVISDIECFHKISQTKPNIVGLKKNYVLVFIFMFSYFCPPFSLKVGYINSGLFRHSSIRPPVRPSVIQLVCDTIRPLGFCNKLSYLNTLWP